MAERVQRLVLAVLGAIFTLTGVWAAFAPRSFYDDFPGGGRHWVRVDGPYNEHLVRDVGELYLALALVLLAAAIWFGPTLVRVAAAAALIDGVPHLAYHVRHLDPFATADQVGNMVSLGLGVVAPALVLAMSLTVAARPRVAQGDAGVVSNR